MDKRIMVKFQGGPFDGTGGWLTTRDGELVVPVSDANNMGFYIYRGRLVDRPDGWIEVGLAYAGWEPMPDMQEVVE